MKTQRIPRVTSLLGTMLIIGLIGWAASASAQTLTPVATTVTAGDAALLTVSGLPTNPADPAITLYFTSEDSERVLAPASVTQTINPATSNYYDSYTVLADCLKRIDGAFSPVNVDVVAVQSSIIMWSDTCAVTIDDPTLSYTPAAPVVRIGETVPVAIRRTIEANAPLSITLYSSDSSLMGLGSNPNGINTNSSMDITIDRYTVNKTVYVSGLALPAGITTTNAFLTSQVGSFMSNLVVTVTTNAGLTVTPTSPSLPAGSMISMTVTRGSSTNVSAMTVYLTVDDPDVISVPSQVTIPAGMQAATFSVTALVPGSSEIRATAAGVESTPESIRTVTVNAPSLTFSPAGVTNTVGGTRIVTLLRPFDEASAALEVSLGSTDPSVCTTDVSNITMPAGHLSVSFTVYGVSGGSAEINAGVGSYNTSLPVTIEPAGLSISSPSLLAGGTAPVTITRDGGALSQEITLSLRSTDSSKLSVPETVTILAGQSNVTFTVSGHYPSPGVSLEASSPGYITATVTFPIGDPELTFIDAPYGLRVGDTMSIELRRSTNAMSAQMEVTVESTDMGVFYPSVGSLSFGVSDVSKAFDISGFGIGEALVSARVGSYTQAASVLVIPDAPMLESIVWEDVDGSGGYSASDYTYLLFNTMMDIDSVTLTNLSLFEKSPYSIWTNSVVGTFGAGAVIAPFDGGTGMQFRITLGAGPQIFSGMGLDPSNTVRDVMLGADETPAPVVFPGEGEDSDGDELPDWWELEYFGTPIGVDPDADPDGDGLNNYYEYLSVTDPLSWDTDGDGTLDYDEDADGDMISNGDEADVYRSNPGRWDTDGDGVSDGVEASTDITHPLHPMSSTNYAERSLVLADVPAEGYFLPRNERFDLGTNGWCTECWFYPQTDGDGTIFVVSNVFEGPSFKIELDDYRPVATLYAGTNEQVVAGGINPSGSIQQLPTNEWNHVATVWAPSRNSFEIYLNGVLLIAQETLAQPNFTSEVACAFSGFSDGYVDDFRVWNYDRSWEEVDYWHQRIYPAPSGYVEEPNYGQPLITYYRFDEGGTNVVDYAYLNDDRYFISGAGLACTTAPAVSLLGSDDEDGDQIPEWWVQIHNLDDYPLVQVGPSGVHYFEQNSNKLARITYSHAFRAYSSIGNNLGWSQDYDDTEYFPKNSGLGDNGWFASFMRYVYLDHAPEKAEITIFTPGMAETWLFINGEQVTLAADVSSGLQTYQVAGYLKLGRNQIFVRCNNSVDFFLDVERTEPVNYLTDQQKYARAKGKFDAQLICDGEEMIVRGDTHRSDPRSVWNAQSWSYIVYEQYTQDKWALYGDDNGYVLPGNQEFGFPFDADTDNLNAYYEYFCGTNPKDDDSDNNGVPDSREDKDGDGLLNREEQQRGSHPLLPDTDDDNLIDSLDAVGDNDPANALSPILSRSVTFGGTAEDYVEMPVQPRFALESWTIEAWVQRDPAEADGGVILRREVGPQGVNYEVGLGDGVIAGVNVPYVRYISTDGISICVTGLTAVGTDWVHLAGTFNADNRQLTLYRDGVEENVAADVLRSPALYGGGPVIQQIGRGLLGSIDDVQVWAEERLDTEVAEDRETLLNGAEDNLVAYYRFDDSTIYKTSPLVGTSANNGTNGTASVNAWTWGQVQDFQRSHWADWWDHWVNSASINGNVAFSTNIPSLIERAPSLRVLIEPEEANTDGARWAYQGVGSWRSSGQTVYDELPEGEGVIIFKEVDGWTSPSNITVSLTNGTMTTLTATYVLSGEVMVEFSFADLATHGMDWPVDDARWRLVGRDWKEDQQVETDVYPGTNYYIEFNTIPGWDSPSAATVSVFGGETTLHIGQFTPAHGAVSVEIAPTQVVASGAAWNIDGGAWTNSGAVLSGLALGDHTLSFSEVAGWQAPDDILVNLDSTNTVFYSVTYQKLTGIQVTIDPTNVIPLGAQWRLIGDAVWQDSGDAIATNAGEYTVEFSDVSGWVTPDNIVTNLSSNALVVTSAMYYEEGVDSDGDGLSNADEGRLYGTDPFNPDTDDDGFSDWQEIRSDYTCGTRRVTSPTDSRSPLIYRGIALDGSAITVPATNVLRFDSDSWTLEAWVKLDTGSENGTVVERVTTTGRTNYALRIDNNVPSIRFETLGGHIVEAGGGSALPPDTWVHLAGVYSHTGDVLALYINGVNCQAQMTLEEPAGGAGTVTLGNGLNGYMDEVRLWTIRRMESDIQTWMHMYLFSSVQQGGANLADITFVIDVSGSMGSAIDKVKANVTEFVRGLEEEGVNAQVAGVRYSDTLEGGGTGDTPPSGKGFYDNVETFLSDWLDPLELEGGGDYPEDGLGGLTFALNRGNFSPSFRDGAKRVFLLITDASIKDLEDGDTGAVQSRAEVIAALQEAGVTVHGVFGGEPDVADIVRSTEGLEFDIASDDYSEIFETLISDISSGGGSSLGLEAYYVFDDSENTTITNAMTGLVESYGAEDYVHRTNWVYALTNVTFSSDYADVTGVHDLNLNQIADWWEYLFFEINEEAGVDPNADPDEDGLINIYEYYADTNPKAKDSNNNGIEDGDEDELDHDGLVNSKEQAFSADPTLADTDDDGWLDGAEVDAGFDPADALSPIVDRVLELDGSGQYVELPSEARYAMSEFTLMAWVKPSTAGGSLVAREIQAGITNYDLAIDASGLVQLSYTASDWSSNVVLTAPVWTALPTDTWSHVAAAYCSTNTRMSIFINGELVATRQAGKVPARNGVGPVSTRVGEGCLGVIDEVALVNGGLSEAKIRTAMQGVNSAGMTGLVTYLRFDDGSSATNNGSGVWSGVSAVPFWQQGAVQDFAGSYDTDWKSEWRHCGTLIGDLAVIAAPSDAPVQSAMIDSDSDGIPDWWELLYFGSTTAADAEDDNDSDGVNNYWEYVLSYDPTNPNSADPAGLLTDGEYDADGDGLNNNLEQSGRTMLDMADTDDDGLTDGEEVTGQDNYGTVITTREPVGISNPLDSLDPPVRRSIELDGSARVIIPPDDKYAVDSWSLELWLRPATNCDGGVLVNRVLENAGGGGSAVNYELGLTNMGGGLFRPYVRYALADGTEIRLDGTGASDILPGCTNCYPEIPVDAWSHLAATYSTNTMELKLYIDGELKAYRPDAIQKPPVTLTPGEQCRNDQVTIGAERSSGPVTDGFEGWADEVRIWPYARSADEIAAEYNGIAVLPEGAPTEGPSYSELTAAQQVQVDALLTNLQAQAQADGATYEVGYSPVLLRPMTSLCGFQANSPTSSPPVGPVDDAPVTTELPSSFSWVDLDGVTPVRDQGACGSCWAFATVASMESSIRIRDGVSTDLSEQYLVSCNGEGWGCNGGPGPAHLFHYNTPALDGFYGAVAEETFPYEGLDEACDGPYARPYRLDGWYYLGTEGPYDLNISNEKIKEAIYLYGGVAVAIYVGPAFTAYSGGIFNTNEEDLEPPLFGHGNHMVTLVGWNDEGGYWILKNSWGTLWGENGYMRIAYGTSGVGEGASYVLYRVNGGNAMVGHFRFDDGGVTAEDFTEYGDWADDWAYAGSLDGAVFSTEYAEELDKDSDKDGMPDWWEVAYDLNPLDPSDAAADPDGDQLDNLGEYQSGTNPYQADTDLNGVSDSQEDADGDELTNGEESNSYGTDPATWDSDGDSVGDGVEVTQDITHPLHPMSSTNYAERSLDLALVPAAGFRLPEPTRFYFGTNGWTVECWIQPETDGDGTIFSLESISGGQNLQVMLDDFRPKAVIASGVNTQAVAGGVNPEGSIQQLPADEWSHLSVIWAPERNSLEIYLNGVLLIARETLAAPNFASGVARAVAGFSDGYIDELRVWNYDRTWEDVDYWYNRLFPAPAGYVDTPEYGIPLLLYYRFDDGGSNLVDFAHLNDDDYYIMGAGAYVTNDPAVSLLGSDDEDADSIPDWWAQLHDLDVYPHEQIGPDMLYYQEDSNLIARIEYFRTFRAYTSIGNESGWAQDVDDIFYEPKDRGLGDDGWFSAFMRYIYLHEAPKSAVLKIFTPAMASTFVYVNGELVTLTGNEINQQQVIDITSSLQRGRNMIFVRCLSLVDYWYDEARTLPALPNPVDPHFPRVIGKFDASLTCDGVDHIVRGDTHKCDPRSVWFVQTWSQIYQMHNAVLGDPLLQDEENRDLPGNLEYGLPFNADTDGLTAFYEYYCDTNPRFDDSNNNGIPDGQEDSDLDGLLNLEEQDHGAHPLLPDTDDDGVFDNLDATGDNDPASALSPIASRSGTFPGTANDYVEFPRQRRFALENWTVEAWVQRDASEVDGGIIIQRQVGPNGVNFELGLGDGSPVPVNVPYVRYVATDGFEVYATSSVPVDTDWIHLAGSYDVGRRELNLFTNGTLVDTAEEVLRSPTIYAGGPVLQHIGREFDGMIDDVRIWKTARSDMDIQADYQDILTGGELDLVAYYRFDDATSYSDSPPIGTSANNGTNGTWSVMPWTWGQVQDFSRAYSRDWWSKWDHAASLLGAAGFATNVPSELERPPSLRVTLLPEEANIDGARWAFQGVGTWRQSGDTIYDGLSEGSGVILFKTIDGWTAPSNSYVALTNDMMTSVTATYIQNGAIMVEFDFINEATHGLIWPTTGAQWRVSGRSWKGDGEIEDNLPPGTNYVIEFADIPGWVAPDNATVPVLAGDTTLYIAQYAPAEGAVLVNISPEDAILAGAMWNVDGGPYTNSGFSIGGLVLGSHTVSFRDAPPWITPADISVELSTTNTYVIDITYGQQTGLYVGIDPTNAVTDGAQWRLEGGEWQNADTLLAHAAGEVTIQFREISGWYEPFDILTNVPDGETVFVDALYYERDLDTDGDGLLDYEEVTTYNTDPLRPDTDEDQVWDGNEIQDITDPVHPMSSTNYAERGLDLTVANNMSLPETSRFGVGTNGWTVETWIWPDADLDGYILSSGLDGTNTGFRVGLDNGRPIGEIIAGTNVLVTVGGLNPEGSAYSIQQLPVGEWSHLSCVWSPSKHSFNIYLNGLLLIAQETPVRPSFQAGSTFLAQDLTSGYIDDLRVWNYDRTGEEVSYWFNRLFPAPAGYVESPDSGHPLVMYLRFDDGGSVLDDFAHLPIAGNEFEGTNYFLTGAANMTTTNRAVSLIGFDDEDGDNLPEWWVKVNDLDQYPTLQKPVRFMYGLIKDCFYDPNHGPVYTNLFDEDAEYVARVEYFKSFRAYASIGAHDASGDGIAWLDPIDNMYYAPKNTSLGFDGRHSAFMKYIYIGKTPQDATLNLFTPGMQSTIAYINGEQVTPVSDTTNNYQVLSVANQLKVGRNMVYVRCISGYNRFLDEGRENMASPDYNCNHFEGVYGKFDASLTCDEVDYIKRGDHTRNDPRSAWVCQVWSTIEDVNGAPPYADKEERGLPGNPDFGLPFDADGDELNAFYEYFCDTNPREEDSDNDGIWDGLEDFDGDGLDNIKEQQNSAHPLLPDTDDDGLIDGLDADPANALIPLGSEALLVTGDPDDYMELPRQARLALDSWTVEALVYLNTTELNGGTVIKRSVSELGVNYELGLTTNGTVNVPYASFASVDGTNVTIAWNEALPATNWIHLAAAYDADDRILRLYVQGTNVAASDVAARAPATYAGGPVDQRVGPGFDGMIDEVRIWKRERMPEEILDNHFNTVSTSDDDLAAYYRMDDDSSYDVGPPQIGTSQNNLSLRAQPQLPWTWGQVQDCRLVFESDWWNKWSHAATLVGDATFTSNQVGALPNPPSLKVTIQPSAVVLDGARWTVAGLGNWYNSGYTLMSDLEPGTNIVIFENVPGWNEPENVTVVLSNNYTEVIEVFYSQLGGLRIELSPQGAIDSGAQWRYNGGEWRDSNELVTNIAPGSYNIDFMEIPDWMGPDPRTVTVNEGEITSDIGIYTRQITGLRVVIAPDAAVSTGALWRLVGGGWTNSDLLVEMPDGVYTVQFNSVRGWIQPSEMITTVTNGYETTITGEYYEVQVFDSADAEGPFNEPRGLAFDSWRQLYVADTLNDRVLVLDTLSNDTWSVLSVPSSLSQPVDVFVDTDDNLYIADTGNDRLVIRYADGSWSNIGGSYLFNGPRGVAATPEGVIYVADSWNDRIRRRDTNEEWTVFLAEEDETPECGVEFPRDIQITSDGLDLYVADSPNGEARIRKISTDGFCREVIGNTDTNLGGFSLVCSMQLMSDMQLLAADRDHNRIMYGDLDRERWQVLTDTLCFMDRPEGITIDGMGSMYIADTYNNRVIRMRLNVPSLIDGHPDFDVLMPSFSGGVNIEWMGEDRVFYDVQYSEALINPSVWYDLCTQMKGTNGTMSCIDTNMGSGIRFYRIIGY